MSTTLFKFNKIPEDDPRVFSLFHQGRTVGIFQLESKLGQDWCRAVKPNTISELSDVIALIRPGSLESGESAKYVRNRKGEDVPEYIHPSMEEILGKTSGVMLYQESAILLISKYADYSEKEADVFRKAVGKKDVDLMAKIESEFYDRAAKVGILNEEQAKEFFAAVKKAQRYSFNCLSRNTGTYVAGKGYISIADVTVGDFIQGVNETIVEVINSMCNGVQDLYKITLPFGYSIECTINHKFQCSTDEIIPLWEIIYKNLEIKTNSGSFGIETVEYLGEDKTYNITVDSPSNLYIANGFITQNSSHSHSYAITSYQTAYLKTYYPAEFFCSWLTFSSEKPDPKEEVYRLVNDAKLFDVKVIPPDLREMNRDFKIVGDRKVAFGLSHIRGIGDKAFKNIEKNWKKDNDFYDFLLHVKSFKRNVSEVLIKSGAVDYLGIPRNVLLKGLYAIYGKNDKEKTADRFKPLAPKEYEFFVEKWKDKHKIKDILQMILDEKIYSNYKREAIIKDKIEYLGDSFKLDTSSHKAMWEKLFLGLPLTASVADDYEKESLGVRDCLSFYKASPGDTMIFHCVVDKIRTYKVKSENSKNFGREFSFLAISDLSANIDSVTVWSDIWEDISEEIAEESIVEIMGKKTNYQGKEGFVADKINIIG